MRSWKIVVAVVVIVAAVGTLVYVRGRDEPASAAEVLEVQRYCELSSRFEGLLAEAEIPPVGAIPETVPPEAVQQALAQFGAQSEELERVAPTAIRADVQTVLGALRRAAEGEPATADASFNDAQRRVADFRQEVSGDPASGCLPGGGSGDS
jgi:hypothetical protein